MLSTVEQQIAAFFQRYHSILVCLPARPTTDAISSGLAMATLLQKLGKNTKVIAADFTLPENHRFLANHEQIEPNLTGLRKFVLSLNVSQAPVENLTYDVHDNTLNIYVTPKQGSLQQRDVTTSVTDYVYDLIIVLDSRDLASLGSVFEQNADFFHHTPIINIDHHPANEHFGQINHVAVTATSISEIIFELIQHIDQQLLDEFMATHLLAGMISKTKSFKTNTVTPRSLAIASHLIASGARREEIVKNLYQTKSINTLKLWGRALAQLQADADRKIVWSVLQEDDFIATGTTAVDLEPVIDELIINTPAADNVYILYQHGDTVGQMQTHALIHTAPYIRGLEAFRDWSAHGTDNFVYVSFPNVGLATAQLAIHERLRSLVR